MGGRVPAFAFKLIQKAVILFIFASGILILEAKMVLYVNILFEIAEWELTL